MQKKNEDDEYGPGKHMHATKWLSFLTKVDTYAIDGF